MAGLVTALALLGGQAGGLLHLLLVEHASCPEHGEMVEGAVAPAGPVAAAPGAGAPVAVSPDEVGAGHGAHDHCAVAARLGDRVDGHRSAGATAHVLADECLDRPVAVACRLAAPLLRLAPKTSPPRA